MQQTYDGKPVPLDQAVPPFVLAIDIGSGSTRCSLYDGLARPVKKHTQKADHKFTELADGTVEIDADQVVDEVAQTITLVTSDLDRGSVSALAMDTFASSLIAVDASGNALTPCITYADSRSAPQLAQLRDQLDEEAIHQLTGTRLHTSYTAPRLLWLAQEFPEVAQKAVFYYSLGEYVYFKLAGIIGAATSTTAWAGILNRKTRQIELSLLDVVGSSPDQFAPIVDPDQPIQDVSPEVARRWPALEGASWFPAIPDGYASNLGVGATGSTTVAMSAATSGALRTIISGTPEWLPRGLWSYTVSKDQSIVGGALNDVGRVALWLESTLAPIQMDQVNELLREPPTDSTPLVLPFFTGERSTGWAGNARGIMTGLSSACGTACIWRGALEGVALSYARVFAQLQQISPDIIQIVASGGVLGRYPGFMDLTGQAIGFPIRLVNAKRVTMRGAAVQALSVIQPGAAVAELPLAELVHPDPEQRAYYERRLEDFEDTYEKLID